MATATKARSTQPPKSKAVRALERRANLRSQGVLVLLGCALVLVLPYLLAAIPERAVGLRWRDVVRPSLLWLDLTLPPPAVPLPPFFPRGSFLQWARWGVALFGVAIAFTLFQHLSALVAQRRNPLRARHVYRQVRVPQSRTLASQDGVALLSTLHGLLPPVRLLQGSPIPLALRLTALPNQPIITGMSILDTGDLPLAVTRVVEGLADGTKIEPYHTRKVSNADPLRLALTPGRWLCAADLQLDASSDFPIAFGDSTRNPLLEALLSSLVPQQGVVLAELHTLLAPCDDPDWALRPQGWLERWRDQLSGEDRSALTAKASGPAFRCALRLVAVAETREAGQTMLATLGAACAGSSQTVGGVAQRLRMGPVATLPAVTPTPRPLPRAMQRLGWALGLLLAGLTGWTVCSTTGLWPIASLVLVVPSLALASLWRRHQQADLAERHAVICQLVPPLRNPQLVPVFWPWLGRLDP